MAFLKYRWALPFGSPKASSGKAGGNLQLSSEADVTPVCEVRPRQRVKLYGVLRSITYPSPGSSQSFTATLFDGTGSIDLVWLGRLEVPGIKAGIHLRIQGMVLERNHTFSVINPNYQIVAES